MYIFGTLSLALYFIHNAVCTKMYIFFQTCTNSVVLICIFLKSCTTIKKLYNHRKKLYISLVHCHWLLISLTMVFVPKCTVFPKLYKFCGSDMYIFEKLYNHYYYALDNILNSDWLNTDLTLADVWLAGSNVRQRNLMSG